MRQSFTFPSMIKETTKKINQTLDLVVETLVRAHPFERIVYSALMLPGMANGTAIWIYSWSGRRICPRWNAPLRRDVCSPTLIVPWILSCTLPPNWTIGNKPRLLLRLRYWPRAPRYMSETPQKILVRQWISRAENDLLNISNNLAAQKIPWDTICFHSQQAAEKYLKAVLVFHAQPVPRTHDLEHLLGVSHRRLKRSACPCLFPTP